MDWCVSVEDVTNEGGNYKGPFSNFPDTLSASGLVLLHKPLVSSECWMRDVMSGGDGQATEPDAVAGSGQGGTTEDVVSLQRRSYDPAEDFSRCDSSVEVTLRFS
jgi:hypothetical protein